MNTDEKIDPIKPYEILSEEFELSDDQIKGFMGLNDDGLEQFKAGTFKICEPQAKALSLVLDTTEGFFLNLQANYDKEVKEQTNDRCK